MTTNERIKLLNRRMRMLAFKYKFFSYRGFRIPIDLVMLTGGGPSNFEEIAKHHLQRLNDELKFSEGDRVLEIGCGIGRDAINFMKMKPEIGSYLGIDIISDSIEWCTSNISRRDTRFMFHHFNIQDALHNPSGELKMSEVSLPIKDSSIDKVFGWSVMTHMTESDIRAYFREIKRVLDPNGKGFFSFFLVNEDVLVSASSVDLTPYNLKFTHQVDEFCFVNDASNPMGAVAYKPELIDKLLIEEGLERVGDFHKGSWSGYWPNVKDGQDGFTFQHNSARK